MSDRSRRSLLRGALGVAGSIAVGIGGAGLLGSSRAQGHRSHVSLTRLVANRAAGTWEFVHAIHFHDAARALARWDAARGWQPTDVAGRARLLLELERRLGWFDPSGQRLSPAAVGAELESDSVRLYQEMPIPSVAGTFVVECMLLHDVFREQRNVIQIELGDDIQRLELSAANPRGSWKLEARVGIEPA